MSKNGVLLAQDLVGWSGDHSRSGAATPQASGAAGFADIRLLAAVTLFTALVIGGAVVIERTADANRRAATAASLPRPTSTVPQAITGAREVRGWPDTTQNPAGEYSWDGRTCAGGQSCVHGFMHNGYASGHVNIYIRGTPERPDPNKGQTVTVAGHDALYRRTGTGTEEWIVGIQRATLAISLEAEPGASDADLAEAHAIIQSMRTETRDTKLGFRLVFTLMTNAWDSG